MLKRQIIRLTLDQRGATAVEYGLILALIFLAVVTAISGVGEATSNLFSNVATDVADAS